MDKESNITKLKKAAAIEKDLTELKWFRMTVLDIPESSNYFKERSKFKLKIKTEYQKSVNLFGWRTFSPGMFSGEFREEFQIPYSGIRAIKNYVNDEINRLEKELENI